MCIHTYLPTYIYIYIYTYTHTAWSLMGQTVICLQCGWPGFDPWVGKIPWRKERLPTPVFWPEEFYGQGAWRATVHEITESDTTERLSHSLAPNKFLHGLVSCNIECHRADSMVWSDLLRTYEFKPNLNGELKGLESCFVLLVLVLGSQSKSWSVLAPNLFSPHYAFKMLKYQSKKRKILLVF